MIVEIWFFLMAFLIAISAMMVLRVKELVHATLWLAAMLIGVAGIFLTLGAEFLAIIQVLVYVGAVVTLILFTVMLTTSAEPQDFDFVKSLDLPPGVTVESVTDIHRATPEFAGEGPYKGLTTTNPRRALVEPDSLYGVGLADNEYATDHSPKNKEKKEAPK
ncbi:MAG: NADH-quinone oxidoreductase subunit J [Candidatus Thermoplasmatota archaeon]